MTGPSTSGVDPTAVLLGDSPAMVDVRRRLGLLGPLAVRVRLDGESGTGKSVAASVLHALSRRAGRPMVTCNLGGLADGTALATLFGVRRGAYTGAHCDRVGKFAAAHLSTLFLDEVALASLIVQQALLEPLSTGWVERVGDVRGELVDVRVITATNACLETLIAAGEFREDLYYRLGPHVVRMPTLAERRRDIPLLVDYFLSSRAHALGLPRPRLTDRDMDRLIAFPWPGNVRQLGDVVEQIVVHRQVPETLSRVAGATPWRAQVDGALAQCQGNKSAAARLLGVSRTSLHQALRASGQGGAGV